MASSSMSLGLLLPINNTSFFRTSSLFVSSPKTLNLYRRESLLAINQKKGIRKRRHLHPVPVIAAQSNFFRVLQTVVRVGKDGIEAGTNLVPASVPRPIARISVAGVAVLVSLFLLKSVLSTAFFVLAMMGLIYSAFIALNKDEGPRGGGGTDSTEDSLEEARRIMEKYK